MISPSWFCFIVQCFAIFYSVLFYFIYLLIFNILYVSIPAVVATGEDEIVDVMEKTLAVCTDFYCYVVDKGLNRANPKKKVAAICCHWWNTSSASLP
jgi:magnesium-transporting ATPase (P-type)